MRRAVLFPILAAVLFILPPTVYAQSPAELQSQINTHNSQIDALNKEIAQYEAQLKTTQQAKNTLQNKVSQLDLQRKKLTASINVTKNQIGTTQLQIQQLAGGIANKEVSIGNNKAGLMESLRRLDEAETQPLAISMLTSDSVSDVWTDIDSIATLRDAVRDDITVLSEEKQELTDTKTATERKKAELVKQQSTLLAQQGSLDATRRAQNELLAETKSQEATYQKILAEKQRQKDAFEDALADLNAKFRQAIDPSSVPTASKGVLRWPLDNVRVTQYFGDTAFSRTGAYNGKGHNGIDLAAPIGTPIKSALGGTVIGVGDTGDPALGGARGCYSFGRWVMVKHANGLSTMYAHMSRISAVKGQSVSTGQVLGYIGETGYATGPHLHFGVYLSSNTVIVKLGEASPSARACAGATMPVPRALNGYLNPMSYL